VVKAFAKIGVSRRTVVLDDTSEAHSGAAYEDHRPDARRRRASFDLQRDWGFEDSQPLASAVIAAVINSTGVGIQAVAIIPETR
jgi:hypothetical protein